MFKFFIASIISIIGLNYCHHQTHSYKLDDEANYLRANTVKSIDYIPSDDNELSFMVTEYYKDLNTFIMPTEKIIPLEVFYDHDGLSFSKTIYECIEYYDEHNSEIMKNIKHVKIIIMNVNEKSYCIMNTDLII